MAADENITAESLRNRFQVKVEKPITLIEAFKDHNEKMESLVGMEFSKGTAESYRTSLKHTLDFLQWKYKDDDIEKVMLDTDLAILYEVETKQLKRQVKRNIDRFPEDFMFELDNEEQKILRSQIGTLRHGNIHPHILKVLQGLFHTKCQTIYKLHQEKSHTMVMFLRA